MKKTILTISLLICSITIYAQIFMAKTCEISFFSKATLENIEALNKAAKPILNTATNDIQVKVPISGFVFKSTLMQEHFNENYMESDKFPNAFFKGKINEKIDYSKDSTYTVTVTGILTMHGVDKQRTFDGTVTVKGDKISIAANFNVHIADHEIKVPSLYVEKIAEDVAVKINAALEPFKKN